MRSAEPVGGEMANHYGELELDQPPELDDQQISRLRDLMWSTDFAAKAVNEQ